MLSQMSGSILIPFIYRRAVFFLDHGGQEEGIMPKLHRVNQVPSKIADTTQIHTILQSSFMWQLVRRLFLFCHLKAASSRETDGSRAEYATCVKPCRSPSTLWLLKTLPFSEYLLLIILLSFGPIFLLYKLLQFQLVKSFVCLFWGFCFFCFF